MFPKPPAPQPTLPVPARPVVPIVGPPFATAPSGRDPATREFVVASMSYGSGCEMAAANRVLRQLRASSTPCEHCMKLGVAREVCSCQPSRTSYAHVLHKFSGPAPTRSRASRTRGPGAVAAPESTPPLGRVGPAVVAPLVPSRSPRRAAGELHEARGLARPRCESRAVAARRRKVGSRCRTLTCCHRWNLCGPAPART